MTEEARAGSGKTDGRTDELLTDHSEPLSPRFAMCGHGDEGSWIVEKSNRLCGDGQTPACVAKVTMNSDQSLRSMKADLYGSHPSSLNGHDVWQSLRGPLGAYCSSHMQPHPALLLPTRSLPSAPQSSKTGVRKSHYAQCNRTSSFFLVFPPQRSGCAVYKSNILGIINAVRNRFIRPDQSYGQQNSFEVLVWTEVRVVAIVRNIGLETSDTVVVNGTPSGHGPGGQKGTGYYSSANVALMANM
ncbi:hypothetical protein B0T20DRAFT_391184 [Sordaria brevicollis]|uniref:Uncharacterized protein n=1 Tax=Sordaria brevicollis TaxID=83679 RepID=A0AAE0UD16_SORBR|nr:hypothetical protein B0T20DRAFT_391184 [Sordaria brevicollis]